MILLGHNLGEHDQRILHAFSGFVSVGLVNVENTPCNQIGRCIQFKAGQLVSAGIQSYRFGIGVCMKLKETTDTDKRVEAAHRVIGYQRILRRIYVVSSAYIARSS